MEDNRNRTNDTSIYTSTDFAMDIFTSCYQRNKSTQCTTFIFSHYFPVISKCYGWLEYGINTWFASIKSGGTYLVVR